MADPRATPRTDAVLADPVLAAARAALHPDVVKAAVRAAQQRVREGALEPAEVPRVAAAALTPAYREILNGTGVVLHTNLGRAALAPPAVEALAAAAGYIDVELDLASGDRSPTRGAATMAALRERVPTAEDVHVVNNGAAALLLAVTTLAQGRDVVVSRGELVEIGAGFRLTDLMESTGARLREVGTTNRTHLADYAAAVGPATGCIVKVHPSNFTVAGFTSSVPVRELAGLGVPVVADIGSGLLAPDPLLPGEPDATGTLAAGADVVTASGDKLLGGPQAGLLIGRADLVSRMRKHPMARALRVDKLTLAALAATLRAAGTPTSAALHADPARLEARTTALAAELGLQVRTSAGKVGGGSASGVELPGWVLVLPERCAALLRQGDPPVVARLEGGDCLLDLRCIPADRDAALLAALQTCLS